MLGRDADPNVYWRCPRCGWRISDYELLSHRVNQACEGCGQSHLSEFLSGEWNPHEAASRQS